MEKLYNFFYCTPTAEFICGIPSLELFPFIFDYRNKDEVMRSQEC